MKRTVLTSLIMVGLLATSALAAPPATTSKPNVLLICVDDLRPELGCYGEAHMKTPRLDKLAAQGRLFQRHYVQVPTCGASRFALLTGRYPRQPATLNNHAFSVLKPGDDVVTLPEAFRAAGYTTVALGKVSHTPDGRVFEYDGRGDGHAEMPDAWDESAGPIGKWVTGWNAFFAYADGSNRNDRRRAKKPAPYAEAADVDDAGYPDGLLAEMAVERLKRMDAEKPFFMAVGFFKPHLPFNAPEKYWDLYDPATIELAPRGGAPVDPKPQGGEFLGYSPVEGVAGVEARERHARRAYFAAVSYVDAQIGKVLDALDASPFADNTIVIVWGDHGWHLGDNDRWGKHTLYERALRSALIVRTPAMKSPGKPTDALVGSVDLYPTLAEFCGITAPDDGNGSSFADLLADPDAPGEPCVRSFWGRMHSYRFDRYRVTIDPSNGNAVVSVYDHQTDPLEMRNVAAEHTDAAQWIERLSAPAR